MGSVTTIQQWVGKCFAHAKAKKIFHCNHLRKGAKPFAEPDELPADAPGWVPLIRWLRIRRPEKEYYFTLAILRYPDGLRFEVVSTYPDPNFVLKEAQQATGLTFHIADWDEHNPNRL